MDSKEWETLVGAVRRQIDDLRNALAQNESAASTAKETLQEAKENVEDLLDRPANPREVFYKLPLTLQALTSQKLVGVFLIGNDGKVVLHHGSGQRLLGIDPVTNKLPSGCFYDGTTGTLVPEADLPWQRCLRGEEIKGSVPLVMRDPRGQEELHLEVSAIPLRNNGDIGGVVTLFRDKTETVKAGKFIKELCHTLEKQLSGIEAAQRELKLFADKLSDSDEGDKSADPKKPAAPPTTTKKVLIVDDIPVNQQLLMMRLRKFGIDAEIANNGLEAVNCCKRQSYSLVFMDIDMPILDGYEAAAEIRKLDSANNIHTPIVALTSFDREAEKRQCFDKGMDDFVVKGEKVSRFREMVDRYVFGKSSEDVSAAPATDDEEMPVSDQPKIDQQWLRKTFGGDTENVIALFFGSVAMLLNCLEFALEDKDVREITHFAYSLKGPCSTVGATAMAERAAELVADAENGHWLEAGRKYRALRQMFRQYQQTSSAENQTGAYVV
jgi:CheY-like chemotaxis protein/PAS domain-containing protein